MSDICHGCDMANKENLFWNTEALGPWCGCVKLPKGHAGRDTELLICISNGDLRANLLYEQRR